MLDVHPPHHAANSWRDFFIHIATIVVGLLIAVGLEQTVEYIHHRRELAEARRLLREERDHNRKNFAANAAGYRYQLAILQNDRLVLQFLSQHPGIREQELPGVLVYTAGVELAAESAWKTALSDSVTRYMDRQEAENLSLLYRYLDQADADEIELWRAMNKAHEYAFNDPDPTHMTPEQLNQQAKLTADCLEINFRWAVDLQDIQHDFPDFEDGPSMDEINRDGQYVRDAQDTARIAAALALTDQRLAETRQKYYKLSDAAEKR